MRKNKTRVLVRTVNAGVHYGTLVSRKGSEVVLADARRLWRWFGAMTLSEVSVSGIDATRSKVAVAVKSITLIGVCEVIPCEPKACATIDGAAWAP